MFSRDGVSGLICLAVSLFLLLLNRGLPPAEMVTVGPAFYPGIVLWFTAGLSAILIATDLLAARSPATVPAVAPVGPGPNYRLVLATFIEFGLYIAVLPELGFRISTALFVIALQITIEWPRSPRQWALVAAVALGTSLVCYVVFEDYLAVLLPRGSWSGM